ncbi:MAG: ABC transporter ATP-binding protein, partial [Sphingomonadales bacterium]|nr:ABC transporter ATP-binding protein [Sphingomonadales bacterium]
VLLCDEPTGALDSATGTRVLQALERAHHELGTTVVIITHNVGIAATADRVFHFLDGRIARIDVNEAPVAAGDIRW